jgi:aspartate aminotransferase
MSYSHLASSIAESPTLKLNEEAQLLLERGEPVIHLGIGEPKNKAPISAILSSAAKLSTGDVKYSPTDGIPSLKKAIIRYTEENYDKFVEPENIIVSSGAKQAIFNLLYALLNPLDEVIILAPYWVSYPEMVRMVNGVPVIVTPEDGGLHPRMEDIKEAVSSSTKAIIVNSPNNPSGLVFSDAFIEEIVQFCESKNIYLIMDDIYHKLVFENHRAAPCYKFTQKNIEDSKLVVINGVSKLYGMTGFRIGWAIAPRKLVEVMTNIQAQTTSCASVILQVAAEGALTGPQSIVENLRMTIENNRNIMMQELKSIDAVRVDEPDGTFYCFPDFNAYTKDSVQLSELLLKRARVVTVPGKEFGMEGRLRLSYAGSVKDITEGVARIRWALDPNSPNEIYIGNRKMVRDWL